MLLAIIGQMKILIVFAILFLIELISAKRSNKIFDLVCAFLIFTVSIISVFKSNMGSTFMFYFAHAVITVSVAAILRFVNLSPLDYAVLFSIILTYNQTIGFFSNLFGDTLYLFVLFLTILSIYKVRLGSLKGNIFNMWLTFLLSSSFGMIFKTFIRKIDFYFSTVTIKILFWIIIIALVIAANIGLIYFLKRILNKHFTEINKMGKAYPAIEKYYIYITLGIMIIVMGLHFHYIWGAYYSESVNHFSKLLTTFCMLAFVIQLFYLTLLFRVTYFKDNFNTKNIENQNLLLYSSDLEKNIDAVKSIKHDIKNVFYTMGQYVEDSGNSEMQIFYKEKIYPFAADEIAKNDIYTKLNVINNEQFKAFLYYKISQALERKIQTELSIDIHENTFSITIEFTDLVRILGILIDNAIEECMQHNDSILSIKISQNNELISYNIKNTVHQNTMKNGIKSGVSTKGENRGNGLLIVNKTIEKYDFVMLNSYFSENSFVQNLNIYFENI